MLPNQLKKLCTTKEAYKPRWEDSPQEWENRRSTLQMKQTSKILIYIIYKLFKQGQYQKNNLIKNETEDLNKYSYNTRRHTDG